MLSADFQTFVFLITASLVGEYNRGYHWGVFGETFDGLQSIKSIHVLFKDVEKCKRREGKCTKKLYTEFKSENIFTK